MMTRRRDLLPPRTPHRGRRGDPGVAEFRQECYRCPPHQPSASFLLIVVVLLLGTQLWRPVSCRLRSTGRHRHRRCSMGASSGSAAAAVLLLCLLLFGCTMTLTSSATDCREHSAPVWCVAGCAVCYCPVLLGLCCALSCATLCADVCVCQLGGVGGAGGGLQL